MALTLVNAAPKSGGLYLSRVTKNVLQETSTQIEFTDGCFEGVWPHSIPSVASWNALRANNAVDFFAHTHFLPEAVANAAPDFLILHFREISDSVVSWIDHVTTSLQSNPHLDEINIPYLYSRGWLDLPRETQELLAISTFGLDLVNYLHSWVSAMPILQGGLLSTEQLSSDTLHAFQGIPLLITDFEKLRQQPQTLFSDIARLLSTPESVKYAPTSDKLAELKSTKNNFNQGVASRGKALSSPAKEMLKGIAQASMVENWLGDL